VKSLLDFHVDITVHSRTNLDVFNQPRRPIEKKKTFPSKLLGKMKFQVLSNTISVLLIALAACTQGWVIDNGCLGELHVSHFLFYG
jgi:hypothetical protein